MKKIIIVVSVFVLSVMLMSIANHVAVVTTRDENRVWHGDGYTYATFVKTETKAVSGELIREERIENVHWRQGLGEFLNGNGGEITSLSFGFR